MSTVSFSNYLQKTGEYGLVDQVNHPIVVIEGLPNAKTHELVVFESGQLGEIFTINRSIVEVRVLSHDPVVVGSKVTRTNKLLSVPCGPEMFGHIVNPLGDPIDGTTFPRPKDERDVDTRPGGISTRHKISKSLITGVPLVDLMVPLGKGQRELIIGDRKTGKTSLIQAAIKNQAEEGLMTIYAVIAKKKSEIKRLHEYFVGEKIMDKVCIVATSSYDSPSMIYLTPYTAMAIAEHFRDLGQDVMVVFDDLSTHAKFYRELSLLARRFPGRDSYPGDIFYTHARLLERAGCFKHPTKEAVTITCMPVIETVEGDLTSYIATNAMGITDGHIFFDSSIYADGRRPAVNIPLSVTRVGRQTQPKISKDINKKLTTFLSEYEKLLNLSHFGAELTQEVKDKLSLGKLIYDFFSQPLHVTVPQTVQVILFAMIWEKFITEKSSLDTVREDLVKAYVNTKTQKFLFDIGNVDKLDPLLENIKTHKDQLLALCRKV